MICLFYYGYHLKVPNHQNIEIIYKSKTTTSKESSYQENHIENKFLYEL